MECCTHNLPMQLFTLYNSKIAVSKTLVFDIRATHNAQTRYTNHVLGSICVFFILFRVSGVFMGGGGLSMDYTTCQNNFSSRTTEKLKFPKLVFLKSWPLTMINQAM